MSIEIKHRVTGVTILVVNAADLSYADLCHADLRGADLRGADLSYADLSYADLCDADLGYADLCDANLRYADLRGADLSYANLRGADLSYADLSGANLRYADLRGADLCGANLRYADLRGADLCDANLRGAKGVTAPVIPNLDGAILAAIKSGGTLNMSSGYTCRTSHCRAGLAVHLAGVAGQALEDRVGPSAAGALIYHASTGHVPDFMASNEAALADIRACAAKARGKKP